MLSQQTRLSLLPLEDRITPSGLPPVITAPIATSALTRLSAAADGTAGNGDSDGLSFSAGGRYVVFGSYATNLTGGDTNGFRDIFRKDLVTGALVRVSVSATGTQSNDNSWLCTISPDGRFVVFASDASNLVPNDTNGVRDIFRKEVATGAITRISTAADGSQGNGGSFLNAGTTDGRYVVFLSKASNLVAGDTNGVGDIFRKDMTTGAVVRVTVTAGGTQSNADSFTPRMSADARYVTFHTDATNLVSGDTNGVADIFRKDLTTGTLVRVSLSGTAAQGNGASFGAEISADGRYVSFESDATNLVTGDGNGVRDVFRKDLSTGAVVRVSTSTAGAGANGSSDFARMSADGRFISFESDATNLVAGDGNGVSDVFRKELSTGALVRVSVSPTGTQSNGASTQAYVSSDGQVVTFGSVATNLLPGNGGGVLQVYATGGVGSAAISVAENTTAVATVIAADPENDSLTFSLVPGDDSANFAINPTTGVLTFVAAPNFEAPTDGNGDNFYEVTVQVSDGTLTDDQDILVRVTNVNEAPVITSGSTFSSAENSTAVTTVTATDQDAGTTLTCSIAGGADAARFAINSTTGVLTFLVPPNFETPTDANGDNVYVVIVQVSDGTASTTQTISVTVTNVNEAPVFTSGTSFSAAENQTAVTTITATDQDAGTTLAYSIAGGADAARFSINPTTGVLTFLTAPNFEAPTDANADNVYEVTVRVSDGTLTADRALRVTVTNVNEAPVITSGTAFNAAENQTVAGTVTATDEDAGTTLAYSIAGGADAARFSINPTTGALAFLTAPNFEAPTDANGDNVYVVIVRASDGTLTTTQTINITVTNVNEAPSINGPTAISVDENQTAVATFTATDPDAGTTFAYSIAGGADAGRFTINATTGVLTFLTAPDFEVPADANTDNVYIVTVQVSDGSLTASRTVNVTVLPVPTLPFSDAFSQTTNSALNAYWIPRSGAFSVATGSAAGTTAGANVATVRSILATDVVVTAVVRPQLGALTATGVVARYSGTGDANMYWGALNTFDSTNRYSAQIWKNVGGVWSVLNFNAVPIDVPFAAGKTLRFEVLGSSLKLYLDDALVCYAFDTSLTAPGGVGLRTGSGAVLDDFAALARPAGTPTLPYTDGFAPNPPRQTLSTDWQDRIGYFTLNNGQAQGREFGANVAILNGIAATDVAVSAVIRPQVGPLTATGLVARYSGAGDANMYWGALNVFDSTNRYSAQIWKNVGGVWSVLNFNAVPIDAAFAVGRTLRFEVVGSSLKLFLNDQIVSFAFDTSLQGPGTVGLRTGAGCVLDEFTAAVKSPTTPNLPFSETFDASLNPQNSLSTNWQERLGVFSVANSRASALDASTANLATINSNNLGHVTIDGTFFFSQAGQIGGLVGRYTGTSGVGDRNMYLATGIALAGGGLQLLLLKNVGGNWSILSDKVLSNYFTGGNFATTRPQFRFRLIGTQLTLSVDGIQQLTASDSSLSTGLVGIRLTQGAEVDNFAV